MLQEVEHLQFYYISFSTIHLDHWQLSTITVSNALFDRSLKAALPLLLISLQQVKLLHEGQENTGKSLDVASNPLNEAAVPPLTVLISRQLKPGAQEAVREPRGMGVLCLYPKPEHPSDKYQMKSSVPTAKLIQTKAANRFLEIRAFFNLGGYLPTL